VLRIMFVLVLCMIGFDIGFAIKNRDSWLGITGWIWALFLVSILVIGLVPIE
jgi:hypothetical protein